MYELTWLTFAKDRAVVRSIPAVDVTNRINDKRRKQIRHRAHVYSNHDVNQGQWCEYYDQGTTLR